MFNVVGTFILTANSDFFRIAQVILEMRAISGLIVAENNRVLRSCGTSARMALMLSVNPILSISSASSITTLWMVDKETVLRSIRSNRRPGVATMMCTPRLRLRIWLSIEEPPYTGNTFSPSIYLE